MMTSIFLRKIPKTRKKGTEEWTTKHIDDDIFEGNILPEVGKSVVLGSKWPGITGVPQDMRGEQTLFRETV